MIEMFTKIFEKLKSNTDEHNIMSTIITNFYNLLS